MDLGLQVEIWIQFIFEANGGWRDIQLFLSMMKLQNEDKSIDVSWLHISKN